MHQAMTMTVVGWRASVAGGLRVAWRRRGLVLLVWVAFIALSAFASLPTWRACDSALSRGPEGDRLLGGLHLALLRELTFGDGTVSTITLPWMVLGALFVALLWNPFVSGGLLTVLRHDVAPRDDGSASVRDGFFVGGARFYGRLTRLLLLTLAIAGLIVALVGMLLFGIQSSVSDQGYEWASFVLLFLNLVVLAGLVGLFSLILDYARIGVVRDGLGAWRAIRQSTRFVFRHPVTIVAFGVTFGLLLAIATGLYVAISSSLTYFTWTTILLAIVLQQAFSIVRTGLRVAMIAGELRMLPEPPPPPPPPVPPAHEIDTTTATATPVTEPSSYDDSTDFPVGLS